jgi:hypothetical protein
MDFKAYPKMVPHMKSVQVSDIVTHTNVVIFCRFLSFFSDFRCQGTSTGVGEFKVGLFGMNFQYYLLLTHESKYNTLRWTLDYRRKSDLGEHELPVLKYFHSRLLLFFLLL